MSIGVGAQLGAYEITTLLGEGGKSVRSQIGRAGRLISAGRAKPSPICSGYRPLHPRKAAVRPIFRNPGDPSPYRSGQEVPMNVLREVSAAIVLTAVLFAPTMIAGQSAPTPPPPGGFPDLVGALKAVPGVLGVDTARTMSGKQVIFAWFENKQAVLNWYNSDVHRKLMNGFGGGARRPDGPLAGVKDDSGPILAIASLTMSNTPPSPESPFPVSQIAIELYKPLPGGLAAGGRFAPAALKVPGLMEVPMPTGAPAKK